MIAIGILCSAYRAATAAFSYLFVSDRPDEWETDRKDLKSGQPLAWVYNYDEPDWPELGYIGVSLTTAAGLRRTW